MTVSKVLRAIYFEGFDIYSTLSKCPSMEWITTFIALLSLASISLYQASAASNPDIIKAMPGLLKQPSFDMFSGYLDGTGTKKLHYWYIESEHSVTDPLIIWLSSGPGCSTIYSALTSNGPFRVQPDGASLEYNPNSWNLNANLLYIDAPVGTGFSYSLDSSYASNDTEVTEDHFQALLSFFTKYPNSTLNVIYIAGDGYSGVYAPLLLAKLDSVSQKLPLQFGGIAIGNPHTSLVLQDNSLIYFAYHHGIIGDKLWSVLSMSCCPQGKCNFHNNTNKQCESAVNETVHDVLNIGINPYKVNGDCAGGVPVSSGMAGRDGFYHYPPGMQHIFAKSNLIQKQQKHIKGIPSWKLKADLTCINTTAVTKYLNDRDVRSALHIGDDFPTWEVCNATVDQLYTRQYPDMSSVYTDLLNTFKYRLLVYSGDQDATHNFLGNEWFVTNLRREAEVQWRPWLYKNADDQDQVAGFVKEYDNIAFLTIKNAGFWAPRDQPLATGLLIYNFINKRPY
ncbi:lysosomal protective protein-like [Acanthaster planci]|uniref:Lysosomal protective protein-like n=1 Tax=Acanthaster planci TaxID=133434 RepID=A0A8B7XVU2_ACAPL|nr:lysosomal protective protein-like [Acanthaster planci]